MRLKENTIGLGETQVWTIPLCTSSQTISLCEALLSKDELARANRFVTEELRERFIVCRGSLRQLLSATVDCEPQDVVFRYEQWGKPQLASQGSTVHFNVSHSKDWALIALSHCSVGIDLEIPSERINMRSIASQVLSDAEKIQYESLPHADRAQAILHLWVCKEAILKALGLGIAEGLRKTTFELPIVNSKVFSPQGIDPSLQLHLDEDGTCAMNAWTDPETWRIQLLEAVPGSASAIATMRQASNVTLLEFA